MNKPQEIPESYKETVLDLIAPRDEREAESEQTYIDNCIKAEEREARKDHVFFMI